jgi:hypothetical protein
METFKINVVNYNNCIVVTGDTKPIKNLLKSARGTWNARLVNPKNNQRFMGWIFGKSRETEIMQLLNGNGIMFGIDIPDNINDGNYNQYIPDPAEMESDNFCRTNNI